MGTGRTNINPAEPSFIQMAFKKNPDGLINTQHAKEEKWGVESIIRSTKKGKPTQSAMAFKKMMGM